MLAKQKTRILVKATVDFQTHKINRLKATSSTGYMHLFLFAETFR